MELILWRHAEAEDGVPDAARELTKKGLDQAERMAGWLRPRLPENALIIVSPTQRTQQTAMALTSDFVTCEEIGPGANVKSILTAVDWPGMQGTVVVVGHQPTLGEVIRSLISDLPEGLSVKKGSVWWIKSHNEDSILQPSLHTFIFPKML